jgi:hypothetical protein
MFISHRINTIDELKNIPMNMPIEFDVRDSAGICIVQHDPFKEGIELSIFLDLCNERFLIINIKSEGIEEFIFKILKEKGIDNFFMLDCTIPVIYKYTQKGEKRFAIRLSEVEPLESAMIWKGKVNWIWVDCFSNNILTKCIEENLHLSGFKICMVSPELQGRIQDIKNYAKYLEDSNIKIDAVCTKLSNITTWKNYDIFNL